MNDNRSLREQFYKRRWIEPLLARAAEDHPVIVLTGARQVGKSTLLQYASPFCNWRYRSLDDLDVLTQAERGPEELWAGEHTIVIDEAQRVPNLFLAVKQAVDQDRRLHFVLSGSANFLLLKRASESLAGRAVHFVLRPMALGEREGKEPSGILSSLLASKLPAETHIGEYQEPLELAINGFMPPLIRLRSREAILEWWQGYVATYLERDLRDLSQVASLSDFRRVMKLSALRTGRIANQMEIARDAAVSRSSVHRYLSLLEVSYLLHRLPSFATSRTKRLIKSPKIYWADPGLAAFLMGHYDAESMRSSREAGPLFENLVLLHLQALVDLLRPPGRVYHWRTVSGSEVDFVLEWGRSLLAFEVKLSKKARYGDVQALQTFISEYHECKAGVLVYSGEDVVRLGKRIVAVPWQLLAKSFELCLDIS